MPVDIMLVANVPEEPDLAFRHKHCHTKCMYGSVSESLVVKATSSIQPVKVLLISLATEEVQVANLEIREELAIVVVSAVMRIE